METDDPPRTASSPGASPGATGEQVLDQLRGLRRSSDDKVLAGVCGGLGRSLGVDPLLLRVVLAVLVFFGGAGIVLYAAGWLLLAKDDGTPSVGAQALDRGRYRPSNQTLWLAVLLAIAVSLGVVGAVGRWDGPLLLTLAVIGLVLWLMRRSRIGSESRPAPAATSAAVPADPAMAPTMAMRAAPPAEASVAPSAPRGPRQRSHLFGITVSVALIGLGVLAAVDAAGAVLWPGAYPALALTVVALGLLVGAWYGRARGLVFWGIVLALVTTATSVAGHAAGTMPSRGVDESVVVTQVEQLPTSDRFGAGQVQYDLSSLDVAGGSVSMRSQIGVGEIVVVVPPNVDVTVDARAGVGGLTVFGRESGGVDDRVRRTDVGADGPGGGSLALTLNVGFGHLEVRRAAA